MSANDDFITSRGSLQIRFFNASPEFDTDGTIKLAVFTHPWAPLGGNMHDPVLSMLRRVFMVRGFNLLIYNSRFSFTGLAEAQDLQELVRGTVTKLGRVDVFLLLGYSHGSLIASLHPLLPPPTRTFHILLSYPLSVRGLITLFSGSTYESGLKRLLRETDSKVFIIYGDQDQFTALQKYQNWIPNLRSIAKGKLWTEVIDNADHFWGGLGGEQLCLVISQWLDGVVVT